MHSEEGQIDLASAIFRAFKSYKYSVEDMDTLLKIESASVDSTNSDLENINKLIVETVENKTGAKIRS